MEARHGLGALRCVGVDPRWVTIGAGAWVSEATHSVEQASHPATDDGEGKTLLVHRRRAGGRVGTGPFGSGSGSETSPVERARETTLCKGSETPFPLPRVFECNGWIHTSTQQDSSSETARVGRALRVRTWQRGW